MKNRSGALLLGMMFGLAATVVTAEMPPKPEVQSTNPYQVQGTVSTVDHVSGLVTVTTGTGPMRLHFPPSQISELKSGDKITTQLGFWTGTAPTRHGDVPATDRQHTMQGTVRNIDHKTGKLSLQTSKGELQLQFPAEEVSKLSNDQQITVELAFHKVEIDTPPVK